VERTRPIDGELLRLKEEIQKYAEDYGLDFYPVVFEVCDYDTVNILAAQGGFPARYPHWRFGMEYDQLSKGYRYGMQKIYEMVINTNPCYAYLLNANNMVDQKTVMAHVYGHADFFKNNAWFRSTNRDMMDVMANHGTKVRRYMERFGVDKVEAFIDTVLSLENLLDTTVLFETEEVKRNRRMLYEEYVKEDGSTSDDDRSNALKSFMNAKKKSRKGPMKRDLEKEEDLIKQSVVDVPSNRDIMRWLMERGGLKDWQSDIIGLLRDEAYYFLPQRMTKIMNEGWASYWHSTIMTKHALNASEIIDFADHHAGVMAMGKKNINPYKIGIELFRDIEYRWNTGKFGKEYNECTDMQVKENWNRETNLGREKIFEVRKTHNDITFIDEFFTQDFCERQKLFTYKFNNRTGRFEIDKRDFEEIKKKLLLSLTNFGQPVIEVQSDNYKNRGEILFRHVHQGVDLDINYASATLRNIHAIWGRPTNLLTRTEDKETLYHFDGKDFKTLNDK
jgi:stage V sporulation protein R